MKEVAPSSEAKETAENYPASHYGRDALVGIALFLTHLAKSGRMCELRQIIPLLHVETEDRAYSRYRHPMPYAKIKAHYSGEEVTDIDGVKIDFPDK